jgi:tRNA-specific adenosine deaminase 3
MVSEKQLNNIVNESELGDFLTSELNIKKNDPDNYICTNYYAYLTHEPCSMCSMALVHSRILKIFYLNNVPNGYLFSNCKLQTVKNLHHKFQVFKASNIDGFEEDSKLYFK